MKKPTKTIRNVKEAAAYALSIGASIVLLFLVILFTWMDSGLKAQCRDAVREYGGDCVGALVKLVEDESKSFRARNDAVGALGMIGDIGALPALKRLYTGNVPPREPLDRTISQYELRKAIGKIEGEPELFAKIWRFFSGGSMRSVRNTGGKTVIVSDPADPYHSVAADIAKEENLELFPAFADVLERTPEYVVLVAAPANLTAQTLSGIGRSFRKYDYYPGFGIISGSTPEKAKELWARRNSVAAGEFFLGGDTEIPQGTGGPTIFELGDDDAATVPLSRETLVDALRRADFFYWSRHTGPRSWSWNEERWTENDQLRAQDIPELKPAVVWSPTCSSFRPWVDGSMALAFTDGGAAAFTGFLNTPHASLFMRRGTAVPGAASWSGFPIGIVAQIQNRTAAETLFSSPQLFVLGDPRIGLLKEKPYEIEADRTSANDARIISGSSGVRGVLAVRIEGGARYGYLEVAGLTATGRDEAFYNNRLQTLDLGSDKYALFLHDGGKFELRLSERSPFGWAAADAVLDAFDYSWAVLQFDPYADGSPDIFLVAFPALVAILSYMIFRRKKPVTEYGKIFLIALAFTCAKTAYFLLRSGAVSVSPNLVDTSASRVILGFVGSFACTAGGLILMKEGRKAVTRIAGFLLATLRQAFATGFYLTFITFLNVAPGVTKGTGPWLLRYDFFLLTFAVFAVEAAALLAAYRPAVRRPVHSSTIL